MPKKYAKHGRNKRKPNPRQQKFVRELASGKTLTQAAKNAGYSDKNPAQSGYQALAQLRGRVPELLERHGLGEEVLIEKYLLPLLQAEETKFFPTGITVPAGKKNKKVFQVNVQALGTRLAALRTAFELHGSYAPRDPKEAAQYGVRIIRVDIPRPDNDPVLALVPKERRHTLLARSTSGGSSLLEWNVVLQGEQETVFFDW